MNQDIYRNEMEEEIFVFLLIIYPKLQQNKVTL